MNRFVLSTALLFLVGCATQKAETAATTGKPVAGAKTAVATLEPKSGSQVTGTAEFHEENGEVTMNVKLQNLPPGKHAVHLHEKGDCSAPDASSAGPHWNPNAQAHGMMAHGPHHAGDIGNVEIQPDGTGTVTLTTSEWSIGSGQPNDILGHALVVHANADDFTSQPAGNAGSRVACGVVNVASR